MNNKIQFIYFDLGGVMFNYDQGLIELAKKYNITLDDFNKIFNQNKHKISIGQMTLQELWNIYKKTLNIKDLEDLNFLEYWTDHLTPINETHKLSQELSEQFPIGVLSNLYLGTWDKLKQKKIIPSILYKTIIQSCEVKYAKPEIEIYKIAQETIKISPNNILFIDDTEENIKTAKELNWQTIKFETSDPLSSIKKIKKLLNF